MEKALVALKSVLFPKPWTNYTILSWRGTLVAAKIIKTAKIRKDWTKKKAMEAIANGEDVDAAIKELDDANDMPQDDVDLAVEDFRREISVLKSLRHP